MLNSHGSQLKQILTPFVMLLLMVGSTALAKADTPVRHYDEAQVHILQRVAPAYPPIAHQMHLSGVVILDMLVNQDGSVGEADAVSGNPILTGAAESAAKHWKFSPIVEAGKPAQAVVRIAFKFVD